MVQIELLGYGRKTYVTVDWDGDCAGTFTVLRSGY